MKSTVGGGDGSGGAKAISISIINDNEPEQVKMREKAVMHVYRGPDSGIPGEAPKKRRSCGGLSRLFRRHAYKYHVNKFPSKKYASEPNLAAAAQEPPERGSHPKVNLRKFRE